MPDGIYDGSSHCGILIVSVFWSNRNTDPLIVDVATVEDGIATLEMVKYLLAEEAVHIGQDAEFHIHHPNKNFAMARLCLSSPGLKTSPPTAWLRCT